MIITSRPDSPLQIITVDIPHRPSASVEDDVQMMDDEQSMETEALSSALRLEPLCSTPSPIEKEQLNKIEAGSDQRTGLFQTVSYLLLFQVLNLTDKYQEDIQ
jgi:hypothetical protein